MRLEGSKQCCTLIVSGVRQLYDIYTRALSTARASFNRRNTCAAYSLLSARPHKRVLSPAHARPTHRVIKILFLQPCTWTKLGYTNWASKKIKLNADITYILTDICIIFIENVTTNIHFKPFILLLLYNRIDILNWKAYWSVLMAEYLSKELQRDRRSMNGMGREYCEYVSICSDNFLTHMHLMF